VVGVHRRAETPVPRRAGLSEASGASRELDQDDDRLDGTGPLRLSHKANLII
jgi:hypothetical protein